MKEIIYREAATKMFYLYKTQEECENLEEELEKLVAEHSKWEAYIVENNPDGFVNLEFIKKG